MYDCTFTYWCGPFFLSKVSEQEERDFILFSIFASIQNRLLPMMTFISCAKTMTGKSKQQAPFTTLPVFENQARENAIHLSQCTVEELERLLKINHKLASENYLRYQNFLSADNPALPALLSYTGIVFKRINPKDFTADDWSYAQKHLRITSFLYGLLRPLDTIKNYRLEGDVRMPENGNQSMFDYWKPLLTEHFIKEIEKESGILINLASSEMKDLFNWRRVSQEVRVVTPEFMVHKNGKLSTVVVYAKMCRGEMTRYILKNRIESPEALKDFEWEGFAYNEQESTPERMVFTL